jgi:ATP-dependent DNA helicase RecQ
MPNTSQSNLESFLPQFRLTSFRPGQKDVISTILAGQDCLCVMPTGGGKSLCYQLPAIVLDGLTLVVSPLIALMKDQVDQLDSLGLDVTFINSTLSMAEQHTRLDDIAAGKYRLVYVVPERFRSSRFLEAVRTAGLNLLAVDEAHCISEWGHDFRPDYARLGNFRRILGNPVTIALTATATDAVRRDIVEQLKLDDPQIFITGFARPNLFYEVKSVRSDRLKGEALVELIKRTPGSGIVYASSRRRTEEVSELINRLTNRKTVAYHAGMLPDQRRNAQEDFMSGRVDIVVATTAFGMGIDKADVRFVVHYNLPGTLEAYYQEAGRAGRDGKPSRCLLLYNASDRFIQEFFIESAYPAPDNVARVYDFLRAIETDPIEFTQQEIKERLSLQIGADGVGTCEQMLESAGVLERLVTSENKAMVRLDSDLPTLVDLLPKQARVRRAVLRAVERLVGTRRNEMVNFRVEELLEDVDQDTSSAIHALRELNKLDLFTYIPPFRGRAIRMLNRTSSFDELEIDFQTTEKRKAAEYEKLNKVVRFALSRECRQQTILRYFGDPAQSDCGHCDNCGDRSPGAPERAASLPVNESVTTVVRMALSGVARTQARFRCGKTVIAQMLCGSGSAKLKKLGLNSLSTFGLLKHLKQQEVVDLLDGLTAGEYAEQVEVEPMRPVVQLTAKGAELMKGTAQLEGELLISRPLMLKLRGDRPESPPAAVDEIGPLAGDENAFPGEERPAADPQILEALRQWRRDAADDMGVPVFYVLSNSTMGEVATWKPDSPEALLDIKGIGPAKLEQFGDGLLSVLKDHRQASAGREPVAATSGEEVLPDAVRSEIPAAHPVEGLAIREEAPRVEKRPHDPAKRNSRPEHYWTWRLFDAGFTADECMAIRNIDRQTLLQHAVQAAEDGRLVAPRWCLSEETLGILEAAVGSANPDDLESVMLRIPNRIGTQEVRLFLASRAASEEGRPTDTP